MRTGYGRAISSASLKFGPLSKVWTFAQNLDFCLKFWPLSKIWTFL
jgi:hypothetical protein